MLTPTDRERYAWQIDLPDFGEAAQEALKNTSVLVSRVGGLGGPLAQSLAAAGVGKIILAHAGDLKESDLNRQVLMTSEGLGTPRIDLATESLRRFKDDVEVIGVGENISEDNAADLVSQADLVCSAAPLFTERLLLNREAVRQKKPLVDAAMFDMQGHVMPIRPGETACLACTIAQPPHLWKRRFPVIGSLSAMVAQIAVLEAIKLITDLEHSQAGKMIFVDGRTMDLRKIQLTRRDDCEHCGTI